MPPQLPLLLGVLCLHSLMALGLGSYLSPPHHIPSNSALLTLRTPPTHSTLPTGALTNPLDVVKTRLQTRDLPEGVPKPTFTSVVRELLCGTCGGQS